MSQDHPEPLIPRQVAACQDLTTAFQRSATPNARGYLGLDSYEPVFEKLARALHRGGTQHAVLVADQGVDPETFIADFARRAFQGWLPFLREKRVVLIDARHTVPEESRDRLLAILAAIAPHKDVIACLSGFESLLRSPQGTHREALMCALDSVSCRLVGALKPHDYEELFAGDLSLENHFVRVDLPEPPPEEAEVIVGQYGQSLAEHYNVSIDDEVIHIVTSLSANYVLHERLPGKARRILQRICQDIDFDRSQLGNDHRNSVTPDDVLNAVAETSGVPQETLRGIAEKRDYDRSLKEFIIGQDHAVKEVATELGLIKAGLVDDGKPASVMMFVGQTGTGKTEMAKALARFYSNTKRLRTYTLGNMVEAHSVSSIIGVPPGYVGHDRGGKIVQDLNADPHCVFLLDEADKAHPDVLQPFLNLFDEGWVRDQRGVQAFANKAIFVLTTNVGQRMIMDMAKNGKTPEEMAARMKETLAQIKHAKLNRPVFAPEFLARLKRVIVFQPLARGAMLGISQKLMRERQLSWQQQRGKTLEVSPLLVESIGEEAHHRNDKSDGKEGGRIVRKLLSEYVDANLQRAISESPQEYTDCRVVRVNAVSAVDTSSESTNGDDDKDRSYLSPDDLAITVELFIH